MNIAYIATPKSIHDSKWINAFLENNKVIVICAESDAKPSYLNADIKVYPILPPFPYKNLIKKNKVLNQLKEIIEKEQIEIIHTMYTFPNAFWVNLIKFPNHIITTRGSDILVDYKELFEPSDSYMDKRRRQFFINQFHESLNNARYVTSTSVIQQSIIKTFVNDPGKLKLIRTGISIDEFLSLLEAPQRSGSEKVIFSPRSMRPIYNIDIIVTAFAKLLPRLGHAKLVIINDVPDEAYAQEILGLIEQLGIGEHCRVCSKLTKKEMANYFVNSDLVVSIPKTDGSPNSVMEAMLARKMVIMGNYEYDSELFSLLPKLEHNGVDELAETMEHYLTTPADQDLLDRNFELVNQFANLKHSVTEVGKLYSNMLSSPEKSGSIHSLFIAAWYPHEGNVTNGNFIKEHARAVALFANVSVVFVSFKKVTEFPRIDIHTQVDGKLTEYFVTIYSPLRRFEVSNNLTKSAYRKVIKLIESKQKIDICHINVRDIYTKSLLELDEIKVPVVITEHFSHYHTGIYQLPEKEQKKEIQSIKQWFSDPRIKCVMPVSKQLGKVFTDRFDIDPEKIIDIPNVADECFYYEKKDFSPKVRIILVANWHAPKNPLLFLNALTRIAPHYKQELEIDWIGDGSQMPEVKAFAAQHLSDITFHFHGTQPKSFIAEKFREASFFVHPTNAENLPTVIIESLCCGTPVLSHRVNGIPELVDDSNGLLCMPEDVDDFVANFVLMMEIYYKFDREKIATKAQSTFYVKPISNQLKAVYLKTLNREHV
ncbi:MAG: glycosyltransferase family 4 protein [Flavobacteriales bacterium]|nr:glycosyltransferase family 4 protein [Flavobacteriales bacterium]